MKKGPGPTMNVACEHETYLPVYSTVGSAGADLTSSVNKVVGRGSATVIPTGVFLEIPPSHVGLICPRSGLALNHRVTVLNAPGVVDSDYRGEISVILVNHGDSEFFVESGMRIAQILFVPVTQANFNNIATLSETERGVGGFGSTGT